jgi:hypothetical protein
VLQEKIGLAWALNEAKAWDYTRTDAPLVGSWMAGAWWLNTGSTRRMCANCRVCRAYRLKALYGAICWQLQAGTTGSSRVDPMPA